MIDVAAPRPSEIHVWIARPSAIDDPDLTGQYLALLSSEQRARHDRFRFAVHRHEYLVTRALERTVLARYLNASPASLTFVANAYGRPSLDPPRNLDHNLTNTPELVACAVGCQKALGIDAEPLTRGSEILALGDTVFTPDEREALGARTEDEAYRQAVRLWTLKESYIKARAIGMSLDLQAFGFPELAEAPRIRIDASLEDEPSAWQFRSFVSADHCVSIAVRTPTMFDVRVFACVPLVVANEVPFVPFTSGS